MLVAPPTLTLRAAGDNEKCTSGGLQSPAGVLIMLTQRHDEKLAGENTGVAQLINLPQPVDGRPAVLCNRTQCVTPANPVLDRLYTLVRG